MIRRYSLPEMENVWTEQSKLENWMMIEILACEAMVELALVPAEALAEIKRKASFDLDRVREIERRTRHDVVAFLENLAENIGPDSRYLHMGMTSSDILDTGLAMQLRKASEILIDRISTLLGVLKRKALEYRDTPMMGRSHGVHAEPITLGLKLAVWSFEMRRNLDRLLRARDAISYGKISGAVGTYANLDPFVEKYVCEKLGLNPEEASTQIIQRDRHAEFMSALAITAVSLEKCATEIRGLQRTEVMEAEEPFKQGQTGSSAMPHKRNPIICERICGLSRVLQGNMLTALQNVVLWHERDISHSSAERVILPDSTILLDYILFKFTEIMEGLVVYPEKMLQDIQLSRGLIFSEKVLLALVGKGLTRQEAYKLVQRNAMKAAAGRGQFLEELLGDPDIKDRLTADEIGNCFDIGVFLARIDTVFERLENLRTEP
ncbi:MAG: adenylosuccinate lyase [Actinobacteria bacterium]|nr:adenylosuccinate lyase [Actinomycetota bacterium]